MGHQAISTLNSPIDLYLDRYALKEGRLANYEFEGTNLIVVIPCHNEPDLIGSLESIANCDRPGIVQVIVVINSSEVDDIEVKTQNLKTHNEAVKWADMSQFDDLRFHFILDNEMPKKYAGVGLARKIGMDEAVRIYRAIERPEGVILCFDADCDCEKNLLTEVHSYFDSEPKSPGCSIHFEHRINDHLNPTIKSAITDYELHLRYYINALKYAGFPYAHQTIGSSMAVRAIDYCRQGGMNRRKAGEDFYFLNKIIPIGGFGDLSTTCVYPSSRPSDRVPFGTGKAVGEWIEGKLERRLTYNPKAFVELKSLLAVVDRFFHVPEHKMKDEIENLSEVNNVYLTHISFGDKLTEIKMHSTNIQSFHKRFYAWFNGFMAMKYAHFIRDNYYENIPISDAVEWLFGILDIKCNKDSIDQLIKLRSLDKFGAVQNS